MRAQILISAGLLILSYFLTFIIKIIALKHSVMDMPNERSSHVKPTPRGGGLAIVISWYVGLSLFWYMGFIERNLYFALISGIILATVSLLDDIIGLPPFIRLLAQFVTAALALWFINRIAVIDFFGLTIDIQYILIPVAFIGLIWFINLYNFLDGIDGYASLEAIIIAMAMLIFTGNSINLIIITSVAGFLIWNWPKAKIFMGDIGSTQLGFVLGILGIYFHNKLQLNIFQWLMLTSLFWFDATLTLFRRWRNKEKLSIAHRKHVYQRAVQSGFSHLKTILLSLIINVIIIGFVFVTYHAASLILPLFIVIIILLYIVTKFVDQRVPFN